MPFRFLLLLLLLSPLLSLAIDNGLALTPQMGYNTWNDFRCKISDKDIRDVADALIANGLDKVGYEYINIDDCWARSRDTNGTVIPDAKAFPNGIKAVADYVHSKGLKFGIYSDRGLLTCRYRPGSLNHEKIDAQTYADWGVDYLKEDSCFASRSHEEAFTEYGRMRDALNATGRPIFFSLCGWKSWYAPQGKSLGNSWRIAGDINLWVNALNAIDINSELSEYAGPGGFNDPDMLVGSSKGSAIHFTETRSRTMFSLWSIMASPLLIGSNIRNLTDWDKETLSNVEVIKVNQDSLGKQGVRIAGGNFTAGSETNVWAKPLANSDWALIFINNGNSKTNVTCNKECISKCASLGEQVTVRDLWAHTFNGTMSLSNGISYPVEGEGGSVLVRLSSS